MSKANPSIDWLRLETDFILNPSFSSPRDWLKEYLGWADNQILAGNTQKNIIDWGRKRADFQRELQEKKIKDAKEQITQMLPELYAKKWQILNNLLNRQEAMTVRESLALLRAVKLELNEPLNCIVDTVQPVSNPQGDASELTEEELNEALGFND